MTLPNSAAPGGRWEPTLARRLGSIRGRITADRSLLAQAKRQLANATSPTFRKKLMASIERYTREILESDQQQQHKREGRTE